MKHEVTIVQVGEGKKVGTMDVLQRATDAGDVHEWDTSLE
jgi:hypothetical protein